MPQTQAVHEGFRRLRKAIIVLGTVLIVLTVVIGWFGDRRSCQRQIDIRRALIANREINRAGIKFWADRGEPRVAERLRQRVRADEGIRQLDCNRLLPGV